MLSVRKGEKQDYKAIEQFIKQSAAIYEENSFFVMVEDENQKIVGVVGIEMLEHIGWLRSFVFSPHFPSSKLPVFFERILVIAREHQCEQVYFATNHQNSVPFFETFGFSKIRVEELPEEVKLSTSLHAILQKKDVLYMWKTLA